MIHRVIMVKVLNGVLVQIRTISLTDTIKTVVILYFGPKCSK
jgi:hypothetical protein